MKIQGLVKNKILQRTKTIVEENDIDKLVLGGGMRQFEEFSDSIFQSKNTVQEKLFGGVETKSNYNIDYTNNRTLFTKEAIQNAITSSKLNNDIENQR